MNNLKSRLTAAASALVLVVSAVGISLVGGGAADATVTAPQPVVAKAAATGVTYPLAPYSVGNKQLVPRGITSDKMDKALVAALLGVPANGVTDSTKIAPKAVQESDLSDALAAKVNAAGPTYLAGWGEIFRNTIGNGRAQLGQSSAGESLNLTTPTGADAVHFGNEADFAGKPVVLTTVKYDVFTTGENAAKGPNNMPSIKFEMNPDVGGATYTTLVYAPGNSTPNAWTSLDAGTDTGKHWGFTGTWFNADPARCGLNGARCTLTEALAVLGSGAKFISAGVGKGRDFEFHGAVRSLTINAATYKFAAGGVLTN